MHTLQSTCQLTQQRRGSLSPLHCTHEPLICAPPLVLCTHWTDLRQCWVVLDEHLPLLLQSRVSFRDDVHGLPSHRLQRIHSCGHQALALRGEGRGGEGRRGEGRGESRREDGDRGRDIIARILVSKDGFQLMSSIACKHTHSLCNGPHSPLQSAPETPLAALRRSLLRTVLWRCTHWSFVAMVRFLGNGWNIKTVRWRSTHHKTLSPLLHRNTLLKCRQMSSKQQSTFPVPKACTELRKGFGLG